ncbi:MAG: tetratricopeptide repeat protein [bacterium]|nr:tetratricopeptide repeat protein [bacterium]
MAKKQKSKKKVKTQDGAPLSHSETPAMESRGPKSPAKTLQRKGPADGSAGKNGCTPHVSTRTVYAVLIVILLLGAGLRVLYLNELTTRPDFKYPIIDADFHDYWARGIAFDQWAPAPDKIDPGVRTSPYFRPPGYPYFLALLYKLFGPGYVWPRIIQFLLGLINVLLAFYLGRRYFGAVAGLIVAGFMSFFWTFIYFEGELHAPVLVIGLILTALLLLGRWTTKLSLGRSVSVGLVLGFTALVRPSYLLFIPAVLVWAFTLAKPDKNWKGLGNAFAGLFLGSLLVIVPAAVRNYVASGEFVLITSSAGINLYLGNNSNADGTCQSEIADLGPFRTCYDYPGLRANLAARLGREVSHSEFSSYLTGKALRFIRGNPWKVFALTARKALLILGPSEVSHNKVVQMEREDSAVLKYLPGNFSFVSALAVLGLLFLVAESRAYSMERESGAVDRAGGHSEDGAGGLLERLQVARLLVYLACAWFVSILPFFAASRYRVPAVPLFLLLASYGLFRLGELLVKRDFKRGVPWLISAIVLFLLFSVNFSGYKLDRARWHYTRGAGYTRENKLGDAAAHLRKAIDINPRHVDAHIDLGVVETNLGKLEQSVYHYKKALEIWPAATIVHYNLAVAYELQKNWDLSFRHYSETLRLDPTFQGARQALDRVRNSKARL